ncbi:hypothetical protein GYA19_01310 [Candidatus Beckwithbacteria bacterium]|nr:hypothetical protein [Candidatus Beckwithbacteria bacterium]
MKIKLDFLRPRLFNVLLTMTVFPLPFIQERARYPEGGYEVAHYRPIFLLATYLQMQDWYPFFLMVGLLLVIYFVVSGVGVGITALIKIKCQE